MLGKLAYRNTKRNIKDYLIYLITVTASFSLIFAFNLVANSDEIVKLCSSMDAFKNSLFAVNILIIFVICFLINYTTKFKEIKRVFGIPSKFTITNDTNWLNKKPIGIANTNAKIPNSIFSITTKWAISFFLMPRSIYVPNSLLLFSNINFVV